MPKLYEYFGLTVLFYSNEHEPVHVHGLFQGTESRAELVIENGKVVSIHFSNRIQSSLVYCFRTAYDQLQAIKLSSK